MKLSEVFERIGCGERDELARRVSNVSRKPASITAEEIERGVTLERLETIGVPVFRYQTQITIHGSIPDFDPESRPLGYKAIFRNGNGSLGVKYVAIDADKKAVICRASRFRNGGFSASINSTGLFACKSFVEKADCIAALQSFPRNFYGSVCAGALPFGGYAVFADIGAIDAAQLWPFIAALWQIDSLATLEHMEQEREAEYAARRAAQEVEIARHAAERAASFQASAATIAEQLKAQGFKPLARVPAGEFVAVAVRDGLSSGVRPLRFTVTKGSFGRRFYIVGENSKRKVFDSGKAASLQRTADAGLLFTSTKGQQ